MLVLLIPVLLMLALLILIPLMLCPFFFPIAPLPFLRLMVVDTVSLFSIFVEGVPAAPCVGILEKPLTGTVTSFFTVLAASRDTRESNSQVIAAEG